MSLSPNLVPNNARHASKIPKEKLPPSLLRQESNAVAISFIDVPTATVVADEFTVFTINVIEKRMRKSAGSLSEVDVAPIQGIGGQDSWVVMKRYSSMRAFHQKLRKSFLHTRNQPPVGATTGDKEEYRMPLPPFPPTKWFGNRSPKFVEQRRYGLNYYFTSLLKWANVGQTADLRMRLLREYLTFSDPEIAAHRMFQGMQHGPKELLYSPKSGRSGRKTVSSGNGTNGRETKEQWGRGNRDLTSTV